jgi:ZIP family zinc transporter
MLNAALLGGLCASSLLVGFALTGRWRGPRLIGMIMGFGAGALLSAIAYELIPASDLSQPRMALAVALGALSFFVGDWLVDRRGGKDRKALAGEARGSGSAIFIGTLLDNIPESLVLGMGLVTGGTINIAFAAAVFASNLPEGVAGTTNLLAAGRPRPAIFRMWLALVLVSALSAAGGYALLLAVPAVDGHLFEAFAAGAMLTMLADTMMPEAFEHGGPLVGLVTVVGFLSAAALSSRG